MSKGLSRSEVEGFGVWNLRGLKRFRVQESTRDDWSVLSFILLLRNLLLSTCPCGQYFMTTIDTIGVSVAKTTSKLTLFWLARTLQSLQQYLQS